MTGAKFHLVSDSGVAGVAMTLEEVQEMFSYALQSDLEHGVGWMNEEASKAFAQKYPKLIDALETLFNLETEPLGATDETANKDA